MTRQIAERAGRFTARTRRRRLELADCLIAATAFTEEASRATGHEKDYPIPSVRMVHLGSEEIEELFSGEAGLFDDRRDGTSLEVGSVDGDRDPERGPVSVSDVVVAAGRMMERKAGRRGVMPLGARR